VKNIPTLKRDKKGLKDCECGNVCERTSKDPSLHRGSLGGVICCNGKEYFCEWTDINFPRTIMTSFAKFVIKDCLIYHEFNHSGSVDCPQTCDGSLTRPNFRDQSQIHNQECEANKAELNCLIASLMFCDFFAINEICSEQARKEILERIEDVKINVKNECAQAT
jgi:hypothetical protein